MSDEQDSWFKSAFGVDLGEAAGKIKEDASAAVGAVSGTVSSAASAVQEAAGSGLAAVGSAVSGVAGAVASAATGAVGAAGAAVKKAAATVSSGGGAAGAAGGGGSFPLGGSVGRGGKNAPGDVRAVQGALGIAVDGQCGGGTIGAIEAFQRKMGMGKPDGRVDAGGGTERALAGGGGGAAAVAPAPAPAPAKEDDDSGSLFDKAVAGARNLGGKLIKVAEEDFDAAKTLGGQVLKGVDDLSGGAGGAALADSGGAGSSLPGAIVDSLLGIVGGQFSFPGIALPPDPGFPVGTVAFGQFAGKISVKFKPTVLSSIKAPKPAADEAGIKAIVKELYENASFKWFGRVTLKADTKSAGVAGSFINVSTKVGDVTLEIKAFELGLDTKKIVKASFGSTSANFPLFEREVNGVNYEILVSLGGALEVSPNPAAGASAFTSGGILLAIDVALVAGPPLAAAAVVGIGIVMAGEMAKRDAAIIEGAIDARKAAFDYAFTMTGNEASPEGPRAKAAVAVAKAELAKVAASQKVSLDALMRELALAELKNHDLTRIKAQARQQIFSAYFAEVRRHISRWHKEHSVLAAFTTEADDFIAVERKVAVVFEKQ